MKNPGAIRVVNCLLLLLTVTPLTRSSTSSSSSSSVTDENNNQIDEGPVDRILSFVYGPGLQPHKIVLPARYFYLQLVDTRGRNIIRHVTSDDLKVTIFCDGDPNRQVWFQLLNRKDGSFIIRYKILQSCLKNLSIVLLYKNKHVVKSPIVIEAPVHPDSCNCPNLPANEWLNNYSEVTRMTPNTLHPQIIKDLQYFPFNSVDFDQVLIKALAKFHHYPGSRGSHSLCHYVVKGNEIYRQCYGQHVGFHIFPDSILLSLTRKVYLSDFEFLINLGDWPLVDLEPLKDVPNGSQDASKKRVPSLPIFSWCKSKRTGDILLPTYELTEASLEAMGRVSLDMLTVQANSEIPWEHKKPVLFWRGRDARRERLDLISIARKYPDLINASLTNFFFFRDQMDEFGPTEPHVSFFKFFDYKYQLNLDGTVAAYRFPFLLAGDSVVFKVDSEYMEHFYGDLKPWTHYVPVKANLEDLVERVEWLREHDEEARKIGENGRKYARENLMPLDVVAYHLQVFQEWAKRLKTEVRVREGMVLVEQPALPRNTICGCTTVKSKPASVDIPNNNIKGKEEL